MKQLHHQARPPPPLLCDRLLCDSVAMAVALVFMGKWPSVTSGWEAQRGGGRSEAEGGRRERGRLSEWEEGSEPMQQSVVQHAQHKGATGRQPHNILNC